MDSGMRIAPKPMLTHIIPIILIPDWSQESAPLISSCYKKYYYNIEATYLGIGRGKEDNGTE